MKKIFSLILVAASCIPALSFTQTQKVIADKIIAQVGNRIILKSDIDNAIIDTKRQDPDAQLPPNADCLFLQGQLIQKTLVLQAEKDSITVDDDELEALLDNKIRYFISAYGSRKCLNKLQDAVYMK